ncbi:MAG TPA: DNA cytosine methyltransferase [Candidatus Pelethocola excrementipullorum]|nr:DNA cytosine methyltransferase [Candidatus Pelethocola excrementipullorum]
MEQLTFIDICSGIGGFQLGLEAAGHKCIGFCEYDKFARASYEAMYDTEGEWRAYDVTKLKPGDIPFADVWCFGFPCQDISIAGKQRGLSGERSGIYYSIIDLIKGKEESDKPTYLFVENVKNLLSVNAGFDFAAVLSEMDEAGYDCQWQVLNSKDFGVPQNRERAFLVSNLRSRGEREVLPVTGEGGGNLKEIIGGRQGYRVYDPSGISTSIVANGGGIGAKTGLYCVGNTNPSVAGLNGNVYDAGGLASAVRTNKKQGKKVFGGLLNRKACNSGVLEVQAVLTPDRLKKRQNGRRMKEIGEPMFTLTGQDCHGVFLRKDIDKSGETVLKANGFMDIKRDADDCQNRKMLKSGRIRRLTPRECFRLQGFPDELYEKAAAVNSETQLYKQAGNAVTTTVAYAVAMMLPESRETDEENTD